MTQPYLCPAHIHWILQCLHFATALWPCLGSLMLHWTVAAKGMWVDDKFGGCPTPLARNELGMIKSILRLHWPMNQPTQWNDRRFWTLLMFFFHAWSVTVSQGRKCICIVDACIWNNIVGKLVYNMHIYMILCDYIYVFYLFYKSQHWHVALNEKNCFQAHVFGYVSGMLDQKNI